MTEVAQTITVADVDASIARVIQSAESIWDEWAWQVENQTWLIKGWSSWDEMRRAAYGNLHSITAPRAERPELVSRFRRAGLTQRETAETLGVTERTVQRTDTTEGSRGPARNTTNVGFATPESDDVIDAEVIEDDEPHVNRETGEVIDESTSTPEPPKVRRNPLTDQARDAGWDLRKSVERLERIAADDRFNPNKEAMASHLRGHLTNAIEVCQDLLDRINTQEKDTK